MTSNPTKTNSTSTIRLTMPSLMLGVFALLTTATAFVDSTLANQDLLMRLSSSATNHVDDASFIKYDAPDDCRFTIHPNQDVSLACNLRTVNSEFDTTNFSVIPADHTVSLAIVCNETIMAKSSLEPKSFAHLNRLTELSMEFCKIARLTPDALDGLSDLRNLTIRTHNVNWPALSLEIELESFVHNKRLERLDLSLNNIWSLPENLFCSLTGLSSLNMSSNRLQDVNDLGFREKVKGDNVTTSSKAAAPTSSSPTQQPPKVVATDAHHTTHHPRPAVASGGPLHPASPSTTTQTSSCVLDLEMLDVSHNHFVLLPANGFGILKRLKQLTVRENEISMVDDRALRGLKHLQILDLSSNKIVALPSELFADPAQSIQEIYLQNNSISVLSPKLFANLEQLQALDLASNKITSTWIDRNTFAGLIRLVLLNLSNNRITKLEPEIFSDLYTLQILNLRHNQLETIAADTFSPMNNLHTLLLSHNKIKYLDAYSLNGLYVLSLLSLDNNQLNGVHPEAFRNCSSLQDLNLNGNELKTVPLALKDMRLLRTVDLGENHITVLGEQSFRGMTNLYGLRLIGNQLENVTKLVFKDLPSLQILNLAHNRINHVELGAFEATGSIQAIRLDGNQLTAMDGLFAHMPSLLWLNISDNRLTEFDFAEIPTGLLWLDLHKNELVQLTDRFGVDDQLRLQTMDVSFNRIRRIGPSSVPNSIELLFFNDNLITTVEPHTFMHKTNLTRVDLYANQITSLDVKALRVLPVSEMRPLPEFYIGGNPFVCDCNIDWLQKINQVTSRQYPRIMDLETIYCKLLYNRDRSFISLIEADPSHFLCTYKTHCFALCHCCDFDACDCEMTCPNNCTCFHDQSWSTNVVECSAGGYTDMPTNIPMDTTELYIDGNDLGELSGHSFIGRKNLRVLFANNSNIQVVYNTTFIGLRRLTVLHLENNRIGRLLGHELDGLDSLRELYLQNNRISFIDNRTFVELRKLEVLRLDNNKLMHFEVWQLAINPYLVEIGLADNMWSCECNYLGRLREYLQTNADKIFDSSRIACVYNNLTSVLKERTGAKCALNDGVITTVAQTAEDIETILPLLLAASCAFVGFFGMMLGVFCYRRELIEWCQSTCLSGLCYKSTSFHHPDDFDKDRLYDAYISYSLQDEHFVNQILANTLENNVGYRLCLHYRDFNMNSYVADTIVEAVESSRRTLLVLSRNFLYNEWSRFEVKSAIHECVKRRRKLVFILYGDLPQRDIDADMRMYLRTSTCIEWDDKKFWQKLRIAMPNLRGPGRANNCLAKRSAVNIYATSTIQQHHGPAAAFNNTLNRMAIPGHVVQEYTGTGRRVAPAAMDCNNYATINDCGRNCDKYESVLCKYSTSNERHRNQQQHQLPPSLHHVTKTLDRHPAAHQMSHMQHEYAVPSNLMEDEYPDYAPNAVIIGTAAREQQQKQFTLKLNGGGGGCGGGGGLVGTPVSSSNASSTESCSGGAPASGGSASSPSNVFSFNSSQNCNNCNSSSCPGDDSCPANGVSLNCTLPVGDIPHSVSNGAANNNKDSCIDRRQPQSLWA